MRIDREFGHRRLNQIDRRQIQAFHTALKEQGLSASTCNHYVKLLKHSLNLAVDWDLLDVNPAVRVPLFHEDNKRENYLNEVELDRLLTVLRTDEIRTICQIVLFLLSCAYGLHGYVLWALGKRARPRP